MKNSVISESAWSLMMASSSADGINKLVYILAWIGGVILFFLGVAGWGQGQGFLVGLAIVAVVQASLIYLVVKALTAKLTMDANVVFDRYQGQD